MNRIVLESLVQRFSTSEQSLGRLALRTNPLKGLELSPFGKFSGDIEQFYSQLEIDRHTMIGGDFSLQLFSLEELEGAQSGWSGSNDEGLLWRERFVVFADRNGDALVFESAQENPFVYGSIQQRSFYIAQSMTVFLQALLAGIEIEEDEFCMDTREEDMEFKKSFIDRVQSRVSAMEPDLSTKGFMRFFFE
ncbi:MULTISPECIES: hypothetical protein [Pseudomonas]|uniref:SMI1/KNR4 family protein n=1 Tax=Pseudomonas quercus TaxID=2722792 RepID=A0ABX0YD02_9PSED|nr:MULTISPECIES: hypothetical protein [Pseudomonas]MBF7142723.1 hypothetical protein [Pseudomonas sp. LY10J]NJP01261.1 hypothetical protein [Pseudomonas quercus]